MNEDVIGNMQSRIERFKRLSAMITDKRAIEVLEEMLREAEEDIAKLRSRESGAENGST